MSRIGSNNLFGSLYDPDKARINAVFNQNPTGQAGQAASFAAAQQSERDKQARQTQQAQQDAIQQQQQVASEATAAQSRYEQAQQQAQQEQQFKLQEAQFNNTRTIQAQQLAEQKRAASAQEAYYQNQQRAQQPSNSQAQYQRALGGNNFAASSQNHSAALRGQLAPFPNQLTPGAYSTQLTLAAQRGVPGAMEGLNQNRVALGYKPLTQESLKRWGNGGSYNLSSSRFSALNSPPQQQVQQFQSQPRSGALTSSFISPAQRAVLGIGANTGNFISPTQRAILNR